MAPAIPIVLVEEDQTFASIVQHQLSPEYDVVQVCQRFESLVPAFMRGLSGSPSEPRTIYGCGSNSEAEDDQRKVTGALVIAGKMGDGRLYEAVRSIAMISPNILIVKAYYDGPETSDDTVLVERVRESLDNEVQHRRLRVRAT
ncbi:uncharacterized protein B0H64DRAFT_445962 [Chaetomium fimeti]|uniref:Uncharacterized protein n=1 Tax=Chaetomium fimeti TaxID=1854472 RepID=A0AAE0H8U1_9PEZI|nr:hypothetical protein B0H64DRAFT_445962 [Chaetomium fimeti]